MVGKKKISMVLLSLIVASAFVGCNEGDKTSSTKKT